LSWILFRGFGEIFYKILHFQLYQSFFRATFFWYKYQVCLNAYILWPLLRILSRRGSRFWTCWACAKLLLGIINKRLSNFCSYSVFSKAFPVFLESNNNLSKKQLISYCAFQCKIINITLKLDFSSIYIDMIRYYV